MESSERGAAPGALLAAVTQAVRAAGSAIRALEPTCGVDVAWKDDGSPLTRADVAANAILLDALTAALPGVPTISEETYVRGEERAPARFWLIDPIDGTREFLDGNGEYTVNVALVEDGVPVLGVVHAPARELTYAAFAGGGATRTDAGGTLRIAVDPQPPEFVVAVSRSHPGVALSTFLGALPPHRTIPLGSSLKMCLVADGGAHLYPRLGPTSWWDTAAAQAVVQEAGGSVTGLDGTPLRYDGRSILNPAFVCSGVRRSVWSAAAALIVDTAR
jgi:3'(2'), 5'-bisphosphate nucleotidase